MKINISDNLPDDVNTIVIGFFENSDFASNHELLYKEIILNKIKKISNFNGVFGDFFVILVEKYLFIIVGLGKKEELNKNKELNIGGKIYCELCKLKVNRATISILDNSANIAYGLFLKSFSFDKYKTKKDKKKIKEIIILAKGEKFNKVKKLFKYLKQEGNGVFLARTLISEPPNILYPESYANYIKNELSKFDLEIEIYGKEKIEEEKMGAFIGVSQGSSRDPKLVIIKWNGGLDKKQKPVAFVGKGITFDTGGISLKPSRGMESMKYDMSGSATVVGLMHILACRKAKINAVGIVALAENSIDGKSQRPSDIVTSMSGQTIEVLNTDAEGRLILADILWYTQKKFCPKFMIDIATLTGSIIVALGNNEYAGLFSNNDKLANHLIDVGNEVDEKLWRFPMNKSYDKIINSQVADVQNISPFGYGADSIIAAQFLQRFVNKFPWAHLDIAGTAWHEKGSDICPRGAVGFGVRLLNRLVQKYYENIE